MSEYRCDPNVLMFIHTDEERNYIGDSPAGAPNLRSNRIEDDMEIAASLSTNSNGLIQEHRKRYLFKQL